MLRAVYGFVKLVGLRRSFARQLRGESLSCQHHSVQPATSAATTKSLPDESAGHRLPNGTALIERSIRLGQSRRQRSEAMLSRLSNARPVASLVLAATCWGLGTVLSKGALAFIPPLTLLVTQLMASLLVLWLILSLQRVNVRWSTQLLPVSLLGWLNPGISYTL